MTINEREIERLEVAIANAMEQLWKDPKNSKLDRFVQVTMGKILYLDPYRYMEEANDCQD